MNLTEHLLTCLGEEGAEIAQDTSKSTRFGLADVNFLKPDGPDNRHRLIAELNDLLAVAEMLVATGDLPPDWQSAEMKAAKKAKVIRCMEYAHAVGALDDEARKFLPTLKALCESPHATTNAT